jgi:hypothetical protein
MSNSSKYHQRREQLKQLSAAAKMAIKMGATPCERVNEWLLEYYRELDPDISEFNTFFQWKQKGYSIKKGSKAYVIWGSPVKGKNQEPADEDPGSGDDEYRFFPLCYLFADNQVIRHEKVKELAHEQV